MLGTITSIVLVSIGTAVGIVIVAYAIYITFYPFVRTVGGGFQVMKYYYGKQRAKAFQRDYAIVHDARLGFTMADGGDRIKKKSRKNKK
jgi:predicted SpoU family rRNA methylase